MNEETTEQSNAPRTWLEAVEFAEKSGKPITIIFYKGQNMPGLCCTECGGNVVALPADTGSL